MIAAAIAERGLLRCVYDGIVQGNRALRRKAECTYAGTPRRPMSFASTATF